MDELYEYMKYIIDVMRDSRDDTAEIDMDHAFRLFHMVCYMKQIRGIIEFQDDACENGKHGRKKDG